MIEIRKDKNDKVFEARRNKKTMKSETDGRTDIILGQESDEEALALLRTTERDLLKALSVNNVDEIFANLTTVRTIISQHLDPALVPLVPFFETSLYELVSINLREKNYYNSIDIKKEVFW